MAGLALAAAIVCTTLQETHNQPTMENLYQADQGERFEQGEKSEQSDGDGAQTTGIWEQKIKTPSSCIHALGNSNSLGGQSNKLFWNFVDSTTLQDRYIGLR